MQFTWKQMWFVSFALMLCVTFVTVTQSMVARAAPLGSVLAAPSSFSAPDTKVFINEIHYDNTGTDVGEFIEVAAPAGQDLTDWNIVLYNLTGGAVYDTDALPVSPSTLGCPYGFAVVSYPSNGIQNGPNDGIALVDNNGAVVQFLSYEGTLTASNGPAAGILSTNIGRVEAGSEPIGQSLRLSGLGLEYDQFVWNGPATASPGAINAGQSFGPPCLTSVTPGINAANIASSADILLTFSEPVTTSGDWFAIECNVSGAHSATVSGGPQSYTLNPDVDFANGESCTVTLTAGLIVDQDDTPDPMSSDASWTFNTLLLFGACGDNAETPIHVVQGSGELSPRAGLGVVIEGVVVGDFQGPSAEGLGGFFLQEATPDADPATSEGIFVFNNSPVNPGDVVRVLGTVAEFGSAGATMTEISPATQVQVCSSAAPPIAPTTITLPVSSLQQWEQLEGMLVTIPQELTVTENFTLGRFGEVHLSSGGRLYQPTHLAAPGAPALAQQALNNLNRILLDDGKGSENPDPVIYPSPSLSAENSLRSGDTVNNLTGLVAQSFGDYRIQPAGTVDFIHTNPRTAAPEDVGGRLKIASANVLNFFTTLDVNTAICGPSQSLDCRGANTPVEFDRQRAKIVNGLAALNADVIGLLEIENNPNASLDNLVAGLNDKLGAGTYAYIDTGTIGTDAIKVALLYKPATVTPVGDYAILDSTVDPNFIDTLNRPVLAQSFEENATTERFTVAVNHLKSKGSGCDAVGDPDLFDGQGNCNVTRTKAAIAEMNWLASDPTGIGDPDVLLIGDLNAYAMEDPITAIKNAGYIDLIHRTHGATAYSYIFDGQSGYLDHALASPSLTPQTTGAADWHTNTDEPVSLDYNMEFKSVGQQTSFYSEQPYRFSDHDPLVVGLNLKSETTITIVKDARPNNIRNFRFGGSLGDFRLDDPGFNDFDSVGASKTFAVAAGNYTVHEDVPDAWHLTNISCVGGTSNVDLSQQQVAITIIAGQKITCTFTNQVGSAIWVDKYLDHNADGKRRLEVGLAGWVITLHNSTGTPVATNSTNIFGKVHFWDIAPGSYTVCETQRTGWFNSQPGTTGFNGQPCYSLEIGPAQLWSVEFGNHRNPRAAGAADFSPNAPTVGDLAVEQKDDESYEDDGTFVDPDLNRPSQGGTRPLFLPHITR